MSTNLKKKAAISKLVKQAHFVITVKKMAIPMCQFNHNIPNKTINPNKEKCFPTFSTKMLMARVGCLLAQSTSEETKE